MEARLIEDRLLWNRFIASTPTGHLCQTYEWAEHSPGQEARDDSLRVGVLEGGQLVAAMLLVRSKASGVRAPFYYAPRGPVCADPRSPALPLLIRLARAEARQRHAFMIRAEPNVPEGDPNWPGVLRRLGFRPTSNQIYLRSAWVTDIRPSEDAILARMMMTWRQNIRGGARKGVTVRAGAGEADLEAFHRLLTETGARDDFPVYPKYVFADMLRNYSAERAARYGTAEMALLMAEHAGVPVAAGIVAVHGKGSWSLMCGSSGLPEHRKLRPNYVLQWESMRWSKARGAEFYDFRGIPDVLEPGEEMYGVYEFKRGFGGGVHRVIPTQDLPLRPALYWPYSLAVSARRELRHRRRQRFERRREQERARREAAAKAGAPAAPAAPPAAPTEAPSPTNA
ncbi:MAG TPA: peptidoglycan bridge formation glycyltransferase FemA/FemB family protein [Ktedonobacterales bacterium]|nr:peptidoglycan bridge formation glycyltransferase FemA/FemB family protein [Ktedonobacterales bacterium]